MLFCIPSLILGHTFGQLPRCFAGTYRSCHFCLLLETDAQILERIGATLMRFTWTNHNRAKDFGLEFWYDVQYALGEFYTLDWLQCMSVHFRRIDEDFGGVHVLKYATQLSSNFQHSHCTFVTILLRPFAWLFINLSMSIRALFPKPASILGLAKKAFWEDAIFHKMELLQVPLMVILARPVETFSHWDFCLWDFGFSMHFRSFCCIERISETDLAAWNFSHAY